MSKGILVDLSLCIGCESCMEACRQVNNLKPTKERRLSPDNYVIVEEIPGEGYYRHACMHCEHPTCVSVCPVAAFEKTPLGPVIWHGDKCMGCRYCLQACPFQIPTYEWHNPVPAVRKCTMCYDRVAAGGQPGCTEACPTGAILFGERKDLISEAERRLGDEPGKYVPHIYGLREVGGTSLLYISHVPFEKIPFLARNLKTEEPLPELTWRVLSKLPNVVGFGGVFLFGVYWIINRRIQLERLAQEQEKEAAKEVIEEVPLADQDQQE
ncbi:MAG: 4Fe-4S dicluster domain-containing protein [candidate division KSB1 bacterium]|nr:4Fe-4S dicluster domain-containing protein [candidate division KSB1 bacterium]